MRGSCKIKRGLLDFASPQEAAYGLSFLGHGVCEFHLRVANMLRYKREQGNGRKESLYLFQPKQGSMRFESATHTARMCQQPRVRSLHRFSRFSLAGSTHASDLEESKDVVTDLLMSWPRAYT